MEVSPFSPVMVIGAAGFVGRHLLEQLQRIGADVIATKLPGEVLRAPCRTCVDLDILDSSAVASLLKEYQPASIIHLAAQSSVALSWKKMDLTVDINLKGTLHLLNAVREICPRTRVLLVGSSEEYGPIHEPGPVNEGCCPHPSNPYAISKAAQTLFGQAFHKAYQLDVIIMRAFNHIGAGQAQGFVVPDFCRQIVRIENRVEKPEMLVGNLEAKRDFSDVRDIVRGYILALSHGKSGEIYNIGSGVATSIQTLLDKLLSFSSCSIKVRQDPNRMRPSDTPVIQADIAKLQRDTGYVPQIPLDQSLREALECERQQFNCIKE